MLQFPSMLSVIEYNRFVDLRDEWAPLVGHANARGPFLRWEWQKLWWDTFGAGAELRLLAVREGEALRGIAPLAVRDGRLAFACGADVSDYLDLIAWRGYEEPVARAVIAHLSEQERLALDLCCMAPDATVLRFFPPLLAEDGFASTTPVRDVCPELDLPADWEGYLASLAKKDRHELRRKQRRLMDAGSVRTYALVDGEIGEQEVDDFLALHRLSTPDKAAFMDQRMEGFFRNVFARYAREGYLRLYFMEYDGRRVSTAVLFDEGNQFLLYNSGYDPEYSRLSVGLLLKAYCVQDAIGLGRRRFDFLRGNERYKYDLGAKDVPVYGLVVG
ncbi:MAG: GNAT family N-acetyltransferase [Chloroflexota bacterium]